METIALMVTALAILLFIGWQYSFLRRRVGARIRPTAARRQVRDRRPH